MKNKTALTCKINVDKKALFEKYLFFFVILVIPISQFLIFYLGVNFNTILLSFQVYEDNTFVINPSLFGNYAVFFQSFFTDVKLLSSLKNSLILFFLVNFISMPLSIFITYYLYVKVPLSGLFKVILMLPQMISGMVWVCLFKILFLEGVIPLMGLPANILHLIPQQFMIMCFYTFFFGLAGHMVIYLGSMSNVDESIMEYGELDGLGTLGKLWHVVIPFIYPTVVVFIMTGIAGFFTNQGPLYSFFGDYAEHESYTFGYWLFLLVSNTKRSPVEYPLASTAGVVFTVVAAPLVIGVKKLLEKIGPKED